MRAFAIDESGRIPIDHAPADLLFAPGSPWSEGRIARSMLAGTALGETHGPLTAVFVLLDEGRPTNLRSDPMHAMAPRRRTHEEDAFALAPTPGDGVIRILSWNVNGDAPIENPAPFARVISRLQPDVILLRDWDYTDAQLIGWYTALLGGRWHAMGDNSLAIVSRHPLEATAGAGALSAIATMPPGALELHVRADGKGASSIQSTSHTTGHAVAIVAVDAQPATMVMRHAADNGLRPAEAYVLGDGSQYTWRDPANQRVPMRLDYLLVGDNADIVRAFVLDTTRLSDEALARMGLEQDDTNASDHLPLVVDVRPR